MPNTESSMRSGVLIALLLTGCANTVPVPPSSMRDPEPRTMEPAKALAPIPSDAIGNSPMIESIAQCRLAYADRADRHLGLIQYVRATRKK